MVGRFAPLAQQWWPPPGFTVPGGYQRSMLLGDLVAGVTVAAYLVPQVMAYAGVAGLPPVVGLWATLAPLALYAVLGSSRLLSAGPDATMALMTATVVGPLAHGDAARYAALAATLAIIVGLLSLLACALRLGFVADLLSRPILVGYMTGVAAIMVVGQLQTITGVPVHGDAFFARIASFITGIGAIQAAPTILAAAVVVFLVAVQRRFPHLPGSLIAMLLAASAVEIFGLARHGVAVIGPIPGGVPQPRLPDIGAGDAAGLVLPALGVLLVAFNDEVLTARSFAGRDTGEVDANRELLALGGTNLGAGVFQGFPVSNSASRTALGKAAGSRTQVYSLAALASLLGVLLLLRPVLARFPTAALGGLVVYAAGMLVDVTAFRRLVRFRRSELLLAVATCLGVLVFDILYGVLLAIGLSVTELLIRVARPHDAILGRVPGLAGMHDVDDYPEARTIPGLVVYRYDAPLFFANAENFKKRALAAVEEHDGPVDWFVLNVEANVEVDITALEAVDAVRRRLAERGTIMALARVKQDLLDDLRAFGLAGTIGEDRLFPTLPTAVEAYEKWRETNRGQP